MKITPILYKGNMIRALLDGRKTQTRRIMTPAQVEVIEWVAGGSEGEPADTDRLGLLWGESTEELPGGKVKTHPAQWLVYSSEYPEEGVIPIGKGYGRPGDLLIPAVEISGYGGKYAAGIDGRIYSRASRYEATKTEQSIPDDRISPITLRITYVRVERVQDISEHDACAEGAEQAEHLDAPEGNYSFTEGFRRLWDSINAAKGYGWDANPWVWVIEFEVIQKNIDQVLQEKAA